MLFTLLLSHPSQSHVVGIGTVVIWRLVLFLVSFLVWWTILLGIVELPLCEEIN